MADQTMTDQPAADQRADTLTELSKKASKAVIDSIPQFLDCNTIANHVLNTLEFDYHVDTTNVNGAENDVEDLADSIFQEIVREIDTDELAEIIAATLKKAGFVEKPAVTASSSAVGEEIRQSVVATVKAAMADLKPQQQPSTVMNASALREQTLGTLPFHHYQSITNLQPQMPTCHIEELTPHAANAKLFDSIFHHRVPVKIATTDLVVTAEGDAAFRAAVVRSIPGEDIAIIMQSEICQSSGEALESLLAVSCGVLARARASGRAKGGKLANWKFVRLE